MNIDLKSIPKAIQFHSPKRCTSDKPCLILLDQTKLPKEEVYLHISDWHEVIDCIKTLAVRGAPAIGLSGAAAMALCAAEYSDADTNIFQKELSDAADLIKQSRPTAVNLAWAVDGALNLIETESAKDASSNIITEKLYEYTCELITKDIESCKKIGEFGATLLHDNCTILTHCNAGALATGGIGTALGVVYTAASKGKIERVYSDETRPVNQGARLSVWELSKAGVPTTLICDDMAASVMSQDKIDAVIVGADRIAKNGDVANKIGTLGVAILADYFKIPFYVAAPVSTIDLNTPTGAEIPIEERNSNEVLPTSIERIDVYNPAFDVTPSNLITAIITEQGIFSPSEIKSISL